MGTVDIVVLVVYFVLVLAVGIWVSTETVLFFVRRCIKMHLLKHRYELHLYADMFLSVYVEDKAQHCRWILLGWEEHDLVACE